jgi:hypothetical protein
LAYSRVTKIGDGVSTQFTVNFALDYLDQSHVTARVGTEVDGLGDPVYRTITFLSTNLMQISGPPAGIGVKIIFERTIPKSNLIVDFNNGDVMDEVNLDTAQKQAMMAVQEVLDGRFAPQTQDLDFGNFTGINARAPTGDNDLANKKYVDDSVASLNSVATQIVQIGAIRDEIITVAAIDDDVTNVAAIAADVSTLAENASILSGTASAVYTDEDVFTANGVNTLWPLSTTPASVANLDVWVGGSIQPSSAYGLSGSNLVLTPAIANGVQIIAKTRVLVSANDVYDAKDVAVSAASSADSDASSAAASAASAASSAGLLATIIARNNVLDIRDYGASPSASGSTNSTAFDAWFAAIIAKGEGSGWNGYVPAGEFDIAGTHETNFYGRHLQGLKIFGDGQFSTVLNFEVTSGLAWRMYCRNNAAPATGPGDLLGFYYLAFEDMRCYANTSDVGFIWGLDNGADAMQQSTFLNTSWLNGAAAAGGAVRIIGANCNSYINFQSGARPATAGFDGSGWGLEMVMATFCTFDGPSIGNGFGGVKFTDLGNVELGYSYGNVFQSIDMENVKYGYLNETIKSSKNLFLAGQCHVTRSGGVFARATQGAMGPPCMIFDNPNIALDAGTTALDAAACDGIVIRGYNDTTAFSPALPASTVSLKNTYAQPVQVIIWGGTFTAVTINGFGYGLSGQASVPLMPGDTIAITYSSAPSWSWRVLKI